MWHTHIHTPPYAQGLKGGIGIELINRYLYALQRRDGGANHSLCVYVCVCPVRAKLFERQSGWQRIILPAIYSASWIITRSQTCASFIRILLHTADYMCVRVTMPGGLRKFRGKKVELAGVSRLSYIFPFPPFPYAATCDSQSSGTIHPPDAFHRTDQPTRRPSSVRIVHVQIISPRVFQICSKICTLHFTIAISATSKSTI